MGFKPMQLALCGLEPPHDLVLGIDGGTWMVVVYQFGVLATFLELGTKPNQQPLTTPHLRAPLLGLRAPSRSCVV